MVGWKESSNLEKETLSYQVIQSKPEEPGQKAVQINDFDYLVANNTGGTSIKCCFQIFSK